MKKLYTFFICFIAVLALNAEINYIDYGDGLVIPMNANYEMDIDEDGVIDFYINGYEGELGFIPVFAKGCFTSPNETAFTEWGARELDIHNVGEVISINDINMFDYIDEDRGSIYHDNVGLADGWTANNEFYIGFAVFTDDFKTVSNGWLKVSVNVDDETLILKEMAFTDFQYPDVEPITVGDTGTVSDVEDLENTNNLTVAPNPTNNNAVISVELKGSSSLNISVFSTSGQLIYSRDMGELNGKQEINLTTAEWSEGVYFLKTETSFGIQTKRLVVNH